MVENNPKLIYFCFAMLFEMLRYKLKQSDVNQSQSRPGHVCFVALRTLIGLLRCLHLL